MSEYVIQTEDLTKRYGQFTALDKLNLAVRQGEIFGYLGPNGAGKTTTIRMLLDLIRPSDGHATLFDLDPRRDKLAIQRRVGFLPGELSLWDNQRSISIVRYYSSLRGGVDMGYVNQLAERLQFDLNKRFRQYSTGNKRKLGLILALMHQPDLLILDEPTSGLDPLMQQTFNQLMNEARDQGRTVFLSSHVLSEVQAICDRVGVLRHGDLKAIERVDKLTHADFSWVTVRLRDSMGLENRLNTVTGVSEISRVGENALRLRLAGDFDPLLRALDDRYVVEMQVKDPTLEEIFLAFYDDEQDTIKQKELAR